MSRFRFVLGLVSLLVCTSLFAQTTGNLAGKVTDANGAALPGVTVEARSPSLQGIRRPQGILIAPEVSPYSKANGRGLQILSPKRLRWSLAGCHGSRFRDPGKGVG